MLTETAHFAFIEGNGTGVDLLLIKTFLLSYVNHDILMLTRVISIRKERRSVSKKVDHSLTFTPLKATVLSS